MRCARMLLIAIMCCAAASVSAAEDQLPTAADLKASYCAPVYRTWIDYMANMLNIAGPRAPAEFKSKVQAEIDRDNAGLRRIELYLMPRVPFLDVTGLSAAMKSAEADLAEARKVAEQCKCDLEDAACRESCLQPGESTGRLKSCRDLSFLPF